MGSAIADNPYLIIGIALAAYTGGTSLAATGGTAAAGGAAAGGAAAGGAAAGGATAAAGGTAAAGTAAAGFNYGTALATLSTAATIQSQEHAAKAAEIDAKARNKEEEFSARDREIARRKGLLASMARQNVFSAASGVESFTGSSENILQQSEKEFERGQLTDDVMTGERKRSNLRGASQARSKARINQGSALIDDQHRRTRRG